MHRQICLGDILGFRLSTLVAALAAGMSACSSAMPTVQQPRPPQVQQRPLKYAAQLAYAIAHGELVNVNGTGREKEDGFGSPLGGDWFAEDNLETMLAQHPDLVLMVAAADCPACVYTKPLYAQYAREHAGRAVFAVAEVHYNPLNFPIVTRYAIENTPTFVVFRRSQEVGRLTFTRETFPPTYNFMRDRLDALSRRSSGAHGSSM